VVGYSRILQSNIDETRGGGTNFGQEEVVKRCLLRKVTWDMAKAAREITDGEPVSHDVRRQRIGTGDG